MKAYASIVAAFALAACGTPPGAIGDGGGTDSQVTGDTSPTDAPPPSPNIDPHCTDGRYTETLPNVSANIADVTFDPTNVQAYYDAVLMRRYPNGRDIMNGGLMNTSFGNCVDQFDGHPQTQRDAMMSIDTVVHECGHLYDAFLGGSSLGTNVYYLTSATRFSCQRGDATGRGGDTFARRLIEGDAYGPMFPPCSMSGGNPVCDMYADIYFASGLAGDQGFNMLFEEQVQYVNSLATAWSYVDQRPAGQSTSARDGILVFSWYMERYLHMARLSYPMAYMRLSGDSCWRDAILNVWGRAWLYLQATQGNRQLGINDALVLNLVENPDLLDEIQRLRAASGCH